MRGLDEEVKELVIVQKVVRSLPSSNDSKFSAIEEAKYLNKIIVDELHGIFIAYEMWIGDTKISKREVAFKASKKANNVEPKFEIDEEEANFI